MFDFINFFRFNRNLKKFLAMLDATGDKNLTATDIVSMNEPLRSTLSGAMRVGKVRLEDFAKDLGISMDGASRLAQGLVKKGFFHHVEGSTYDVRASGKTFGHERPQTLQLWAKLDDKKKDDQS